MNRFEKIMAHYKELKDNPPKLNQFINYLIAQEGFSDRGLFEDLFRVYFSIDKIRIDYSEKILDKLERYWRDSRDETFKDFVKTFLKDFDITADCYSFYYLSNQRLRSESSDFILEKSEFQGICEHRLKVYTEQFTDVSFAFGLLYSCWEYVDEDNRIHLTSNSLKLMRVFVQKNANGYLKFLIRSKYVPPMSFVEHGCFDFVFEPFTDKIFDGWDLFEKFLHSLRKNIKVDLNILENIIQLYDRYKDRQYEEIIVCPRELSKFANISAIAEAIKTKSN